ncbi:MAG: GNAT family N-acetyltransferase [Xanthobacteraceae bacterium]
MPIDISELNVDDAPQCQLLSDEARWNQNETDWRLILQQGAAVGVRRNGLVASAAVVPYGASFGWICMVLVTSRERRQGLASQLMRNRIDWLVSQNAVAGLDATPAGRTVYAPLGFQDIYPLARFEVGSLAGRVVASPTAEVKRAGQAELKAIAGYDLPVFGEDRSALLATLLQRQPLIAHVAVAGSKIAGFVLGREGRRATQVGPLIAEDAEIAIRLLQAALAAIEGPVFIDVPDRHAKVQAWLAARGFAVQRGYMRMLLGRSQPLDDPSRVMAITGPEFG